MAQEKLLAVLNILEKLPGKAKPVTGLAYHTEQVTKGTLFVCIKGYKTDGHLYLKKAAEKGAAGAVVEHFQEDINIAQYRVADTRSALAALADHFFDYPTQKINVTGVTATNGKTSTTYMINAILEEYGLTTGLIGTVIVKTGPVVRPAELTTPESLDLQRFFQQMVKQQVTHATIEVSSSGLELKRTENVDFNIVVINNISREHIDLHGSFESYYNAKASLARGARKNSWAILNLDCPYTAALFSETAARTFTYGIKNKTADCVVKDLDLATGRARFTVELNKRDPVELFAAQPNSFEIELSVLGLHSVYNAMAAVLVGLLNGIPAATIKKALYNFKGVERRFELIFEEDFKVIDDHFANSGNINVTMETLQKMDYRRIHLVYAIRGGRGVTVNRENAEAIAYWASLLNLDRIIATTSIEHVEEKDIVTAEERQAFENIMSKTGINTEIYEKLPEAVDRGLALTSPGDVLLLAGCQGMDYGAGICLEIIHSARPELDKEKLFAALKNRVAGI